MLKILEIMRKRGILWDAGVSWLHSTKWENLEKFDHSIICVLHLQFENMRAELA